MDRSWWISGQEFREIVELGFPEEAVLRNPGGGVAHGLRSQTAVMDAAGDAAFEQAGGF